MATVDEIAIKLGVQTGDFKAALNDAGAQVRTFTKEGAEGSKSFTEALHSTHKAMRDFHLLLVGGGTFEVMSKFWEMAVAGANDSRNATSQTGAAVREMQKTYKDLGNAADDTAMTIVGGLALTAKGLHDNAKYSAEYWASQITGNREYLDLLDQTEASEQQAQAMERAFAEEKKKYGDQLVQLTQQINAERQKSTELLEKQKPLDAELVDLQADIAKQTAIMNDEHATIVDRRKAELQILKDQSRETEIQIELEKQRHDDTLQRFKDQLDAQLKGLNNEQQIKLLTDDIKGGEAAIAALKRTGADTTDLEAQQKVLVGKLTKAQGDAEAIRVDTQKKITGSVAEQLEYLQLQHKIALGIATGPEELRLQQIKEQRQEREIQTQLEQLIADIGDKKITPIEQQKLDMLAKQKAKLDEQIGATNDLIAAQDQLTSQVGDQSVEQEAVTSELEKQKGLVDYITNHPSGGRRPTGGAAGTSEDAQRRIDDQKKLNEQIGLKGAADMVFQDFDGVQIGKPHTESDYANASDQVLEQIIRNNAKRIADLEATKGLGATAGAEAVTNYFTRSFAEAQIGMDTNAATAVLQKRTALRNSNMTMAMANYVDLGGNLLNFDQAYAQANQNAPAQTVDALQGMQKTLAAIHGTLAAVFPDQASSGRITPMG
jgi:hypothetical protein